MKIPVREESYLGDFHKGLEWGKDFRQQCVDKLMTKDTHHLHIPWLLNYIINILTFSTNDGPTLWVSKKAQQCDAIAMSSLDIVVNISN